MINSSSYPAPANVCRGRLIRVAGLFAFGLALLAAAVPVAAYECTPLEPAESQSHDIRHSHGLLWRISGHGQAVSYVFGTMHISDPEIVSIPGPIRETLEQADYLVMEAKLDGPETLQFAREMFYQDGRRLSSVLPDKLYTRAQDLLARYRMSPALIESLKPWAAFMTLNMPPDTGVPLDVVLMQQARADGIEISGLETLSEQTAVFARLPEAIQVDLLLDSICHYATLQSDMRDMKQLYLQRDLRALFNYHRKYRLYEKSRYKDLLKSLLWDRNRTMVERMRPFLSDGNAFIAIGAMHLPGEQGVLSLLEQAGYSVKSIY